MGNSIHLKTKTSMIRDIINGENDQSLFNTKFVLWFLTTKCKCRDYMSITDKTEIKDAD